MPNYYLTVPTSITLPADGAKVDLSAACELHRDDSTLPNALTVDNGEYAVFRVSEPTTETAVAPAAWTLDEDFSGLANNAPLTGLANWTQIFNNGDGQIQGTGDGRIKTPRLSGSSSFPGAAVRYEVDIGLEQEVELDFVDLSAGTALVNIGAVLRANDTNCYRTTLSNTAGFRVFKGFTWSATLLDVAIPWTPPPMPVTVNFRAITSGSNCVIECRVNGTLLGSFTDPTPLTGVRIGLGAATGGGDGLSGPFTATAIRARALT